MKYIPTILIVGLNVAIALKMKNITKIRRDVQNKDVIVAGFPSTTSNPAETTTNPASSRYIKRYLDYRIRL